MMRAKRALFRSAVTLLLAAMSGSASAQTSTSYTSGHISNVTFVGHASTVGNRTTHRVTVSAPRPMFRTTSSIQPAPQLLGSAESVTLGHQLSQLVRRDPVIG